MKCIILAGGFAKRLWPITLTKPKPLLPIAGTPILNTLLAKIEAVPEVDEIYISTNEAFADEFSEWLLTINSPKRIEVVVETGRKESHKIGTIGAIGQLLELKGLDDYLIVAGDNLFSMHITDFVKAYDGRPLVALYDFKDRGKIAGKYGVVSIDAAGKVTKFAEKPKQPESSLISTGCYLYPKEAMALVPEYLTNKNNPDSPGYFLEWLHQRGDVRGHVFEESWYDIGDRDSFIKANTAHFNEENKVDKTATVSHSRLHHSYVGANSVVKSSALLNTIVFGDVHIENCALKNCIVDSHSRLVNLDLNNSVVGEHTQLEKKKLISHRRFVLEPVTGTELL